jgi:Tfp pilus assembly protein PilX/cytoskeletal protein CcmA (bactofilin family)
MIDMRHLDFKRRLTGEAGFVLPTAMIVLLILTVLIGAAVTVASQTSTSTTRDNNTKAALEAAEAGLQTASYRLSKLEPKESKLCINGSVVVESECKSSSESLGNGATFQYWTSKGLAVGEKCAGETIATVTNPAPRCITSVGTVNGVQRRLQASTSLSRPPLFEVEGILGYKSVSISNNGKLEGEIGTNGTIKLSPGVTVTKSDLGPSGKVEANGGSPGSITTNTSPFELPTVPIGKSSESAKTTAECKPPLPGEAPAAGPNCDFRITYGINKTNPTEADPASGVTFNSSIRSLSMSNGSSLELYEGIYNFCDFQVTGNNATLKTAIGSKVEIFIDSAKRAKSGCEGDSEAGKFVFKNGLTIENPNKNATYLQIYVYDGSGGTIGFKNNSSSEFYGTIVAPESKIEISNNGSFTGAIEAKEVELTNNFKFKWDVNDKELRKETTTYERKGWEECTPGSGTETGC